MKELVDSHETKLLVVMDGDRNAIHQRLNTDVLYESGALSLNKIAENAAQQNRIHFLDLHPIFAEDFSIRRTMFNFKNDNHWNSHGHKVVASAIYQYVRDNRLVPAG